MYVTTGIKILIFNNFFNCILIAKFLNSFLKHKYIQNKNIGKPE